MLDLTKKVKTRSFRKTNFAILHLIKRYGIKVPPLEMAMFIHRLSVKYHRVSITKLELLDNIKKEARLINQKLGLTEEDFKIPMYLINQTNQTNQEEIKITKYTINDLIERAKKINDNVSKKLEVVFSEYQPNTKTNEIKSLRLKDGEINEISFLSFFENLEELSLGGNNIRDISPVSKLKKLTSLDLGNNYIDSVICLEDMKSLKTLKVGNNNIKDKDGNIIDAKDENEFKWLSGLSKLYWLKLEF